MLVLITQFLLSEELRYFVYKEMSKKQKIVTAITIGILVSFIPFPTVIVPEWKLKVVTENGLPYKNQLVRQFCYNHTLGVSPCSYANDSMQLTDENGYVSFPERKFYMSLSGRIVRSIANTLMLLAHGSVGTEVYLDSPGSGGYKTLKYDSSKPLPKEFLLPLKPSESNY